jgi:hypothetical protein
VCARTSILCQPDPSLAIASGPPAITTGGEPRPDCRRAIAAVMLQLLPTEYRDTVSIPDLW